MLEIKKVLCWIKTSYFWFFGFAALLYGWFFFSDAQPYSDVVFIIISAVFVYFYSPCNCIEKIFYTLFLLFWALIFIFGIGISFFYHSGRSFLIDDIVVAAEAGWRETAEFFQEPLTLHCCLLMLIAGVILFPAVQRGMPMGIPSLRY